MHIKVKKNVFNLILLLKKSNLHNKLLKVLIVRFKFINKIINAI